MAATRSAHCLSLQLDNWREHGACQGVDPELFFPISTRGPSVLQTAEAKAVCATCPFEVREKCLAWALESDQEFGIWGGTTEKERRGIKRRREAKEADARPVEQPRRRLIDRWADYRESDLTIDAIAHKLGVKPTTLYTTIDRARRNGDPRVPPAQPRRKQAVAA